MPLNCTRMMPPIMIPMEPSTCLPLRQPLYVHSLRTCHSRHQPMYGPSSLRRSPSPCRRSPSPCRSPSPFGSPSPSPTSPLERRSCLHRDRMGLRKRVSFADAKGQALSAVRLFIPDSSPPSSPCSYSQLSSMTLRRLEAEPNRNQSTSYKVRLAFTQPSLNFNVFMARQKETGVQLESCSVSQFSLSGKVRISRANVEPNVLVRMSLDSWRSYYDLPCTFSQRQRLGSLETDIYTFELSLPINLDPVHGIEFCVLSRSDEASKWDDNRGQNYKIQVERDEQTVEPVVPGSPKMWRYQTLPLLDHMRNYTELPHLQVLAHMERGMCAVK